MSGVVQGVGFRPFVHRLATELELTGLVGNDSAGVFIEIEGAGPALDQFIRRLVQEAPPLARIDSVETIDVVPKGDTDFAIVASTDLDGLRPVASLGAGTWTLFVTLDGYAREARELQVEPGVALSERVVLRRVR